MTTKRRDALKTLFTADAAQATSEHRTPTTDEPSRQRSGAVKAMGLSLAGIRAELDDARALNRTVAEGEAIVDVDPGLIDAAFVADRLSDEDSGDPAFATLVESIRASGQQVPVLLRPHPDREGRYQTAYGHRRVRACARLGRAVRAVVRPLTDEDLVLAQGKENAERRDLSFIERALFAQALSERGFARTLIQEALAIHKSELARLLAVAEAVPRPLARAIGPAPKAGRPRWLAMADFLKTTEAERIAAEVIGSKPFAHAESDRRFKLLFDRLSAPRQTAIRSMPEEVRSGGGTPLARIARGAKPRIDFVGGSGAAFAEFVAAALPDLVQRFEAERAE